MIFKFALIGCGRISKRHGELLANSHIKNAKLVAVCDIDPVKAQSAGEAYGVPYYSSTSELLKNVEFDVACVLTPSGSHYENSIELMNNKKHVIVEKPMALKLSHADEMIACAKRNQVTLSVVKQNRFNSPVVKLKEELDANRFGKLVMGTVRVRWCRDQSYYDQAEWRGTWAKDGGVFANQASHHVDLLQWVMGDVESVFAKAGTYLVDIEAEDTGVALLKFKNGAVGVIEATTTVRPKDLEGSLSLMGENGNIEISGFAVNKIKNWNFVSSKPSDADVIENFSVNPPNVYGFGHQQFLEAVVKSLNGEAKNPVSGEDGKKSLELITAIYESIASKKEVFYPFKNEHSKLGQRNDS